MTTLCRYLQIAEFLLPLTEPLWVSDGMIDKYLKL